jgi:hypothetical protein
MFIQESTNKKIKRSDTGIYICLVFLFMIAHPLTPNVIQSIFNFSICSLPFFLPSPDSFLALKAVSNCSQPESSQPILSQPKGNGQITQKQKSKCDLSLSYLNDPKAWFRDEDITNICAMRFTKTISGTRGRFFSMADKIPVKLDRIRDILSVI